MPKKCDFLDFQFYNLGHSKKKHRQNTLYIDIVFLYSILVSLQEIKGFVDRAKNGDVKFVSTL